MYGEGPGQATFHRTLVQTVQQQPQLLGVSEAPVERWLRLEAIRKLPSALVPCATAGADQLILLVSPKPTSAMTCFFR